MPETALKSKNTNQIKALQAKFFAFFAVLGDNRSCRGNKKTPAIELSLIRRPNKWAKELR